MRVDRIVKAAVAPSKTSRADILVLNVVKLTSMFDRVIIGPAIRPAR